MERGLREAVGENDDVVPGPQKVEEGNKGT
jgi:hypothetical protein